MSEFEPTSFFADYAQALLDRDAAAVAHFYAVPAPILFPGQSVAVGSEEQTGEFFASAREQYDGIADTDTEVTVLARTARSRWADVTWHHDNGASERLMYQLVQAGDEWQIAVLTPMDD